MSVGSDGAGSPWTTGGSFLPPGMVLRGLRLSRVARLIKAPASCSTTCSAVVFAERSASFPHMNVPMFGKCLVYEPRLRFEAQETRRWNCWVPWTGSAQSWQNVIPWQDLSIHCFKPMLLLTMVNDNSNQQEHGS